MTGIEEIKKSALALGACGKVESINSIEEAVKLLMTPQGREFAVKTGFPTPETWREVWDEMSDDEEPLINGIYILVDSVKAILHNEDCIAVGGSKLAIDFNKPDRLHHIIAMHGAEVEIKVSNYAVVTVTSINAAVKIINDGTALVTMEQSEKGGSQ